MWEIIINLWGYKRTLVIILNRQGPEEGFSQVADVEISRLFIPRKREPTSGEGKLNPLLGNRQETAILSNHGGFKTTIPDNYVRSFQQQIRCDEMCYGQRCWKDMTAIDSANWNYEVSSGRWKSGWWGGGGSSHKRGPPTVFPVYCVATNTVMAMTTCQHYGFIKLTLRV